MKLQLTIHLEGHNEPIRLHKSLLEVIAPVKINHNQKVRFDKVKAHAKLIKKIFTADNDVGLSDDETEMLKQILMNANYNSINVELSFAIEQLFSEEQNE